MQCDVKVKLGEKHSMSAVGTMPSRATDGSAAFDISCSESVIILPGCQALLRTNIFVEFPSTHVMLIFPRSGNAVKRDLFLSNAVAVIDSDYRGEIRIPLKNLGPHEQEIYPGDKVGQIIMLELPVTTFTQVQELSSTQRAEGSFGSTGR